MNPEMTNQSALSVSHDGVPLLAEKQVYYTIQIINPDICRERMPAHINTHERMQ